MLTGEAKKSWSWENPLVTLALRTFPPESPPPKKHPRRHLQHVGGLSFYRAVVVSFLASVKRAYGCRVCHEASVACLDFHHTGRKKFALSLAHEHEWDDILAELRKCVVICRNCHAKFHAKVLVLPQGVDLIAHVAAAHQLVDGVRAVPFED